MSSLHSRKQPAAQATAPDSRMTRTEVRASASLAKQQGFAGSGVDALASAAGLTSGAFYRHFEGKGELLSAIVETELEATRSRFSTIEPRSEAQLLLAIDAYLSLAHLEHRPAAGLPFGTLKRI